MATFEDRRALPGLRACTGRQMCPICRINLPVRSVLCILALCPVYIWTRHLLQTPFNHFLFITLMHSLTKHIWTLTDSFTHTHTHFPILSLQSIPCCPNKSRIGAKSFLPIWPTGLRESHLISSLPKDWRVWVVFPAKVQNSDYSSATQEPRSGKVFIPFLPPSLFSLMSLSSH